MEKTPSPSSYNRTDATSGGAPALVFDSVSRALAVEGSPAATSAGAFNEIAPRFFFEAGTIVAA